jgi:hypothetical protein
MQCPLNQRDVGGKCNVNLCWYNVKGIKGNCAIVDTGNDHLLIYDVARVFKENEATATKRVDRGREKIKRWLKLIEMVDTVEDKGCNKCGYHNCKNEKKCNKRKLKNIELKSRLPLDSVLDMYPSRWHAAVNLVKNDTLLDSITI